MKTLFKVVIGVATFVAGVAAIPKIADTIYERRMEKLFFNDDFED